MRKIWQGQTLAAYRSFLPVAVLLRQRRRSPQCCSPMDRSPRASNAAFDQNESSFEADLTRSGTVWDTTQFARKTPVNGRIGKMEQVRNCVSYRKMANHADG